MGGDSVNGCSILKHEVGIGPVGPSLGQSHYLVCKNLAYEGSLGRAVEEKITICLCFRMSIKWTQSRGVMGNLVSC